MTGDRVLIVTTMSAAGYAQTGDAMLASLNRHLGPGIALRCYGDRDLTPEGRWHPLAAWRDLDAAAPWLTAFRLACDARPAARGVAEGGGYDFRRDARKFAHKVAALTAAGLALIRGPEPLPELLVWLDADTLAHAPLTADWLAGFVPPDALLGWLDRETLYPECGCVIFRPAHPAFLPLMLAFRDAYAGGTVFDLAEWHDSFVLEALVRPLLAQGVRVASLSGAGRVTPHPFVNGPLGAVLDHAKGPRRKAAGRSSRRDLAWPRPEDYWRV